MASPVRLIEPTPVSDVVVTANDDEPQRLWDRAVTDPVTTIRELAPLVDRAGGDQRIHRAHALCLAYLEVGHPRRARDLAASTLRVVAEGEASRPDRNRLSLCLVWALVEAGDPAAGTAILERLPATLSPRDRAQADCLSGIIRFVTGRHASAIDQLSSVIPRLRACGHQRWLANGLNARGLALGYLGRFAEADADFAEASVLLTVTGARGRLPAFTHNRGFIALRHGDIPRALNLFDRAVEEGLDLATRPEALIDRAQALIAAGLLEPARRELDRAGGLLEVRGRNGPRAEAVLASARCRLVMGEFSAAERFAAQAAVMFNAQRRTGWVALARVTALHAAVNTGRRIRRSSIESAVRRCVAADWPLAAMDLRLAVAALARRAGRPDEADGQYRAVLAASRVPGGHAAVCRAVARAGSAAIRDDHSAMLRACREGIRRLATRTTVGAGLDGDSTIVTRLTEEPIARFLAVRDASAVLRWTERARVAALIRPWVLPPSDPVLAAELADLRSLTPGASPASDRRIAELERRVSNRVRPVVAPIIRSPRAGQLREELGEAALISLFNHAGRLSCVVLNSEKVIVVDLADQARVRDAVQALRLALDRKAMGRFGTDQLNRAANRLDALVTSPIRSLIDDRELVIVPTPDTRSTPWSALPSLRARPVVTVPTVGHWLTAVSTARRPRTAAWIAGPGLTHAESEVRGLRATHGGRLFLPDTDQPSTTAAVLGAMATTDLVHIAAHGEFREDQPMFSSLRLADGRLFGHDLSRLPATPTMVILSACHSGLSGTHAGAELHGLAVTLLAGGTSTLIASVCPVADETTAAVMTTFHRLFFAGRPPAAALAEAQQHHNESAFICLGASTQADETRHRQAGKQESNRRSGDTEPSS